MFTKDDLKLLPLNIVGRYLLDHGFEKALAALIDDHDATTLNIDGAPILAKLLEYINPEDLVDACKSDDEDASTDGALVPMKRMTSPVPGEEALGALVPMKRMASPVPGEASGALARRNRVTSPVPRKAAGSGGSAE